MSAAISDMYIEQPSAEKVREGRTRLDSIRLRDRERTLCKSPVSDYLIESYIITK